MSTADRHLLTLFAAARAAGPDRTAYLDRACAGDAALRAEVEALLAADEEAGGFLEPPEHPRATGAWDEGAAGTGFNTADPSVGAVVAGRYRLLAKLGAGGMGAVWMAQQTEPVKRVVAVKLIKAGMDSRQVVARFEAERQALALMDHPNIARIFDGGATADGRPFFVMELVEGVPITEFCDAHRLAIRERLELFTLVSDAVQHAHQKGIIHRDLKPSNVLVSEADGRAVPKVIDFGVAKATGPRLSEHSIDTQIGVIIGTPEYMSPEQAELNNHDIDTRADVYSLGVILYELLTGTPPLERRKGTPLLEALRQVREEDPPRPSARLSTATALTASTARWGADSKGLPQRLRGELDWIVMKALEKDRNRRYESPAALAADLDRFLAGEPVLAVPPTRRYRLRKFARRHRGPLAATAAGLVLLVGGIVGTATQAVRAGHAWESESRRAEGEELAKLDAQRERDEKARALLAVLKERDEKGKALAEAERLRAIAETNGKLATREKNIAVAVNAFFLELLAQANVSNQVGPLFALGERGNPHITVRELLDRASLLIGSRFAGQELTEAAIRHTIGAGYESLSVFPSAELHLKRAIELRTAHLAPDHEDTLESKDSLAAAYFAWGKYPEAEKLLVELVQVTEKKLGADHIHVLIRKVTLALVYHALAKDGDADRLLKELFDTAAKPGVVPGIDLASYKFILGGIHLRRGKPDTAAVLFREAIELFKRRLPDNHLVILAAKGQMARACFLQKNYAQAEKIYREVIAAKIETLVAGDPSTLDSWQDLGELFEKTGRHAEAEEIFKKVLEARPADHPESVITKHFLAMAYYNQGKFEPALPLFEEVYDLRRNAPEHGRLRTTTIAINLAATYGNLKQLDKAAALLDEWLPVARAKYGLKDADTRRGLELARHLYGYAATPTGHALDPKRAEAHFKWVLAAEAELGADDPEVLLTKRTLGVLYWRLKRFAEAVPLFKQELDARARKDPDGAANDTLKAAFNLAVNLCESGQAEKALPVIEKWYPLARKRLDFDDSMMDFGAQAALLTYRKAGEPGKVEAVLRNQLAFWKQKAGLWSAAYAKQLERLGVHLLDQKEYDEAASTLGECLAIRRKIEPDKWTTFSTQSLLGAALLGGKKYKEAQTELLAAHKGLRAAVIPPEARFVLSNSAARLVRLYKELKKPDDEAKWSKELEFLLQPETRPEPPRSK